MMVASVAALPVRRTPVRRGFRPQSAGDFPTLGWQVLAWTYKHLNSPSNSKLPLTFTDDQARHILEMYRLDPETGARVYRRAHEEQAKGWGKSPFAAAIALAEFCGPVCFDGWDADGQPVGVPWGTGGRPAPWIQVVGVSEKQTYNTWRQIFAYLGVRNGRVAKELGIDLGRTLLYRTDHPAALMERVTASAGSREGQELTFVVVDEPQLYDPSNGGDLLVDTILRNLDKTGGWGLFTGNAPVLGKQTVAEMLGAPAIDVLFFARRPSEKPQQDWPNEKLFAALEETYGEVRWVPRDRLVASMHDAKVKWPDILRFFFNIRVGIGESEFAWMPAEKWAACIDDDMTPRPGLPTYACVRIAHDHRSAAVAFAQRQGDRVVLRCRVFAADSDEAMDLSQVETHITALHRLYPARVMGLRRFSARRPERPYPMAGPELAYHGAFFERSAQTLKKAGMALVDVPNSQERIAPASEQLMELVLSGKLAHDGDEDLTNQMAAVEAEPAVKGWKLKPPASEDIHIEAAVAAMFAVQRAMQAPREPSRRLQRSH